MTHPAPLIADLILAVAITALDLGHNLAKWERDSIRSKFAFCDDCGLSAAVTVDQGEPEDRFGSCLTLKCPGTPGHPSWSTAHAKEAA